MLRTSRSVRIMLGLVAGLVLVAGTVSAAPAYCDSVCSYSLPCSTYCTPPPLFCDELPPGVYCDGSITCGTYGVCQPPPDPCQSSYRYATGTSAIFLSPFGCILGYRQMAWADAVNQWESGLGPGSWAASCNTNSYPNGCWCETVQPLQYRWHCNISGRPPAN